MSNLPQSAHHDGLEATANTAIGCLINWSVLVGVYGQPVTATGVMFVMIALTWARTYGLRRAFRWVEARA